MSSPEATYPRALRRAALAILLAGTLAVSACTVQPLYGGGDGPGGSSSAAAELAMVSVAPVSSRVGQEVRNHLIFLIGGGTVTAQPAYEVSLAVSSSSQAAASIQVRRDEEPTASVATVRATYTITETATGQRIARGVRFAEAPYDVSRQQFAALRAQRDAQDRAARETAELLRLAIAQEIVGRAAR